MTSLLTVSFLVATLFAGCSNTGAATANNSTSSSKSKGVIYGIYKAGDQTWFIQEGAAAKKAAEAAGYTFTYVDAKMDSQQYSNAIDNAIANKAAGIVTCPVDQTMSQAIVTKAKNANIPIVSADDALQDGSGNKLVPWVGIDGYNIGVANGDWLANYAKTKNLLTDKSVGLLIMTMDTVSSVVPRTKGELDAFTKGAPDFPTNRIFKADYDGTTDKGNSVAAAIFTAHPEIKTWLVTGGNEEGTIGASRALESAGLQKNAVVVGLGAYLAKDEWKKASTPMKAAAYFSSNQVGQTSVQVLLDQIGGKTPKMSTAVSATIVTPENYKSVMGADAN